MTTSDKVSVLSDSDWIVLDPALCRRISRRATGLAEELAGVLGRRPQVTCGAPERGRVLLDVRLRARGIRPQGYKLSVRADGIRLTACDDAGVFYGLQTVRQILLQTGAHVPMLEISDYPDFPQRGLMLDASRCKIPTMSTLRALVDKLSVLKINQLQFNSEHAFAYSAHEPVWCDTSPMTAEQILELDDYCHERFIEFVPNQNSFGHTERWLRHSQYRRLAECPDGFEYPWGGFSDHGSTLHPSRASLRLLGSLYDELLPNFRSSMFNVGCDETWELGKGRSRERCEEVGTTRVYLEFLKEIQKLVAARGRTMMFWGDIILHNPELIPELPENTIALEWGYAADHDFVGRCPKFKKAGVPFYVCPGTAAWNTLTGMTEKCLGNQANAARNGKRFGAIGYLNTDWGDGGHHQFQPVSYFGYAAGAAYSWCFATNEDADIADVLNRWMFQDRAGVAGGLFRDLGKVLECLPEVRGNGAPFNHFLFNPILDKKSLKGVTPARLRKCIHQFDALEARLADVRMDAPDAELVCAEFRQAVAMARHGAKRGLMGLDPSSVDRKAMRQELQALIGRYEDLWLARNRRGGLRESSARLRKALKDY